MAHKVILSEDARRTLVDLANESTPRARDLALVLLSLRQNPAPNGSRALEPTLIEPHPGERIWERQDWWITYKVDAEAQTVEIGMIEHR